MCWRCVGDVLVVCSLYLGVSFAFRQCFVMFRGHVCVMVMFQWCSADVLVTFWSSFGALVFC